MLARGVSVRSSAAPSFTQMRRSFSTTRSRQTKNLSVNSISEKVRGAEYAVRGELVMHAEKLAKLLAHQKVGAPRTLPFDEIVYCNIGNPQSLGQKPLTYFRQYLSLVQYPELMNSPQTASLFPKDIIARAQHALQAMPGGMGAYSHSQGLYFVRKSIAEFIGRRDGYDSDPDNIFVYNGASPAVQNVLRLMVRSEKDGIMIPIPQYPLYSASIRLLGGSQVGYYLNEEGNWSLSVAELDRARREAEKNGVNPRAVVIINPGNPTGQCLPAENMKEVIEFCHQNRLVLMADEVYQENVYMKEQVPFNSFKRILKSLGPKYQDVELFSFHSISKGFVGECGQRGGYVECAGIDEAVKAQLYKLSSILLCPNTSGQLLLDVMVNPPKEGEASYSAYVKERDDIYNSLKRRAQKLTTFLNTLEGVTCNPAQGAMYAFAQIRLPAKAVAAAESAGKRPDDFYCLQLLDQTGVCVVPGSGFGQKPGTHHFRTTFLPSEAKIDGVMERLAKFHKSFMQQYK